MKSNILFLLIAFLIGFIVSKFIYQTAPNPITPILIEGLEQKELSIGNEQTEIIKTHHKATKTIPKVNTPHTDTLTFSNPDYTLNLFITNHNHDSLTVNYFLSINHKYISRTDTLKIIRIDTLQYVTTPQIPFYQKPIINISIGIILGSIITSLLIN